MSAFEWTVTVLILVGMVIPFWIMVILTIVVVGRTPKGAADPGRARNYAGLMREFSAIFSKEKEVRFDGPSLIACIRDLKEYSEYRDASVLLLEEINITGSGKFDEMAKAEIKKIEAHLLELRND